MNKKIYYLDKHIEFIESPGNTPDSAIISTENLYEHEGKGLRELLFDFMDPASAKSYRLSGGIFSQLIEQMKPLFHYIEAAGGFIENKNKYLFIHRHGRWDLPKGKLEKGESKAHGAIRECEEECGVKDLSLEHLLGSTWHVYEHKGGHALKQTYWYKMQTAYSGRLKPQVEEDIHEARWFETEEIKREVLPETYYTISDVVKKALKM